MSDATPHLLIPRLDIERVHMDVLDDVCSPCFFLFLLALLCSSLFVLVETALVCCLCNQRLLVFVQV